MNITNIWLIPFDRVTDGKYRITEHFAEVYFRAFQKSNLKFGI